MKYLLSIMLLLVAIHSNGQYNKESKTFASITDLKLRIGEGNGMVVTVGGFYNDQDGGGGRFKWVAASTKTPVSGMIVQVTGVSTGRWERVYDGGKFNYLWFGAKGDSVTYNTFFQVAIDYISKNYPGKILLIPPGNYIDTSHTLWKTGCNIEGYGAYIISNLATRTGAGFGYQNPLRIGNMGPSDWDSVVMNTYHFDSIISGGSKIVMHNMPDSVQVGKIMMVRSSAYWLNARGLVKPYITRLMYIVKRDGDSAWFEHPIDTTAFSGNFSMELDFKNNGNKVDAWGQLKKWICHGTIRGLGLKSMYGQIALGCMNYVCEFTNMYTYGFESISGNGQAWCTFTNMTIDFWKQIAESSIGSHDNTWIGIDANWQPRTDGLKPNSKQPLFKFGENVYNITFSDIKINAGDYNGRLIWFGSATHCRMEHIKAVCKNLRTVVIYFSTTDEDPDDEDDDFNVASWVTDCKVNDITVFSDRTNRIQHFVEMAKPVTLGKLSNNIVENSTFYGTPTQGSVKIDGVNPVIRNCTFENGGFTYGDSLHYGSIENSYAKDATLTANSNVVLSNIRTGTTVLNTTVAGDFRPLIFRITSDVTTTSSTLTASGLKLPVAANKFYTLVATIKTAFSLDGGTAGVQIALTAPTGASFFGGNATGSAAASNNNAGTTNLSGFGSAAGLNFNRFNGQGGLLFIMSFSTSSTAGFIELTFASSDNTSTATIKANSIFTLYEGTIYSP